MKEPNDHLPLSRLLKFDEIKEAVSGTIEATPAEMAAIAKLLDLRGLERLGMTYRLRRIGAGRVRLNGELAAKVIQTCVVSLDPVLSDVAVPVEAEFWPEEMIAAHQAHEEEQGAATLADWPEPISEGRIDLGPVVYETLATSLDPYPRKEGVSFEWSEKWEEEPSGAKPASPFAALEALKRR
ncbi:DUF177 domain-containing protein [Methyloceanibacter sp.]|uniref:YceD family protein n=1 Tax=Methyloceanibacter sp. TaxID=1965321 RepID=UPI002D538BC2|nr:DUF177 domain-containing protein [Methyloceanibacter sp.]HZP08494.1 DUF177 domain-containing protein [Methyloceanibacter sp.]